MKSLWLTCLTILGTTVFAGESQASWLTWYQHCAQLCGKETWLDKQCKSQQTSETIDWVEYYKGNSKRLHYVPLWSPPTMQWAVPNNNLPGAPLGPPSYPSYPPPYGYPAYPH